MLNRTRQTSFLPTWLSSYCSTFDQRQTLKINLSLISDRYLAHVANERHLEQSRQISAAAGLLNAFINAGTSLKDYLVIWLTDPSGLGLASPLGTLRAVIAALSSHEDEMSAVIEKSLSLFGDKLFISHAPMLSQETLTQILLLSAGYMHRKQPMYLFTTIRSSIGMKSISNRIAASSERARLLGMIVGMALSEIIDKGDKKMKFELEKSEENDFQWYRQLLRVNDPVGDPQDLAPKQVAVKASSVAIEQPIRKLEATAPKKIVAATNITGPRIVEVLDDSEEDEDYDLKAYAKPDSDQEDEYDDPTLVERNKPKAPVYILDLIAGLQDQENYDRHYLALSTASTLIRRKSGFGKEVTDHIDELLSVLLNLNDHFEVDNFQELRQQALIAVLLASPEEVAPYFARVYFEGEYAIQQRIAILTALGLGARELAGFNDHENAGSHIEPNTSSSFPSKTLPSHLHNLWISSAAQTPTPIMAVSKQLQQSLLEPMALEAADKLTGPNILKVRTFSSRMEIEKKRKKPIANKLAKMVADKFFLPLTGRWWSYSHVYGANSVHAGPHLLPVYLRTLALLLHSSGPSTLSLPVMTSEFWDLLLSLRERAQADVTIMESVLFALLMLLEMNEDQKMLAQEHGKELLEAQAWVKDVFDRLKSSGRGAEEDEKVKMQAAGVLVQCQEIVEKYQRMLMGDMVEFSS
jgi:telomere length regulation protein